MSMRASGLLTRPAAITYVCIALLWIACIAGAGTLHETTSRAANIYRLGSFSIPVVQLSHELQLEQILSLASPPAAQSETHRSSLQAQFEATRSHVIDYWTARGRFNNTRYGRSVSDALIAADTALSDLEKFQGRILAGKATSREIAGFYSSLLASLQVPVLHLENVASYGPDASVLRMETTALARFTSIAAREAALGVALAANRDLDPASMSEWRAFPAQYTSLLEEYDTPQTPSAFAALKSLQNTSQVRNADRMLEHLRNSADVSFDDSLRASLLASVSEKILSLNLATIHRLADLSTDARQVTRQNGYLVTALVVLASLATFAAVRRHYPDVSRPAFIALMLAFSLALTLWALTTGPNIFSHETGPLETLQAIAIAVAFALFCREAATRNGASRAAAVILTAACFLMFFREVDFRLLGAPDGVIQITSGPVRRILFLIMALIVAAYALLQRGHVRTLSRQIMSLSAWPLFAWFILLLIGEAVEAMAHITRKDDLPGYWAGGQFFEELLELNAYIALVFSACVFGSIFPSGKNPDGKPRGAESGSHPEDLDSEG